MARKPSVRYWESRGGYCCEYKGVQHVLASGEKDEPHGECYSAAVKAFALLVCGTARSPTLSEVSAKYVEWLTHNRKPETVRIHRQRLAALCRKFADTEVAKLTSYEIEKYCNEQREVRGWGDSTVGMALLSIKSCLRWAAEKGVIEKYPLGKLEMPTAATRGDECILSSAQADAVVSACKRSLRDFVIALRGTGARPGEIARAEASHYDADKGALVYSKQDKHKTSRKTKKPRIIYLTGDVHEMVKALVKRYPTGPLFRTSRAKAKGEHAGERWGWTAHDIALAFYRLRKKTKITGLMAYAFRHTYAVNWLRAGKAIDMLAVVMGTSITMIMEVYGHHHSSGDHIRQVIEQ